MDSLMFICSCGAESALQTGTGRDGFQGDNVRSSERSADRGPSVTHTGDTGVRRVWFPWRRPIRSGYSDQTYHPSALHVTGKPNAVVMVSVLEMDIRTN